ncbi:MAG TPA: hypothetical protein VF510_01430, partial [Ktedonobacterales bacterium]
GFQGCHVPSGCLASTIEVPLHVCYRTLSGFEMLSSRIAHGQVKALRMLLLGIVGRGCEGEYVTRHTEVYARMVSVVAAADVIVVLAWARVGLDT